MVGVAGRAALPHLRMLLGPWTTAQHDPHGETAAAARAGYQVIVFACVRVHVRMRVHERVCVRVRVHACVGAFTLH